jgi:hypothetical protein
MQSPVARQGISAVLLPGQHLDSAVLDLAAVLEGLVADRFEIILVARSTDCELAIQDLHARAPGLPLRQVGGDTLGAGCNAAELELIFLCAPDGDFDVRELNHLMDAIECGADVAVGYRPHRTDAIFRRLQRWGWNVDIDCAFKLFRRDVWQALAKHVQHETTSCAEVLGNIRRLGYRIDEVPVHHRRSTSDAPAAAGSRAA